MAQTQINGGTQIKSGTIGDTQIASGAAIALTKLAKAVVAADGTQAFTADQSMGSNKLTNLANGVGANDAVTLSQAQALLQGLSALLSVQAMTTGTETFTIVSGSVTQIAGTTLDGVSPAVGDRILIKNAPAATGAGVVDSANAGSLQPANGVYTVTNATTNLTVTRDTTSATPLSGAINPAGKFVFAEAGAANKGAGYIVVAPSTPDVAFTYGTTNMQWGKFNASGGSVTTVSVVTANGFGGSVANASTTPAITITTGVTGIMKGNGTAAAAAVAGTDYMAPANWVANETPSGTVNGANTSFTLANTPNTNVTNPLMVYLNGELQEPGAGNDYTVSGTTLTMLAAPATGDKLRVYYWK